MKGQVAIPETSEGFEECLNDDGRMNEILAAGQFGEFTQAYIKASMGNSKAELAVQMREQLQLGTQQVLQDWEAQGMRPKPGAGQALNNRDARKGRSVANSRLSDPQQQVAKQKLFNPAAMGACVDDEEYSSSLGSFIHAVYVGEHKAQKRGDTEAVAKFQDYKTRLHNALSERIPAEGGFLVPEVLRSEILMVALEKAIVRPRARIIPMDSLRVPLPSIDDTSHSSSVYGGVVGYWTEEGAALTASAPSFSRVVLEAKKLTAYTTIPNELLQDSVTPLDTWFNSFFPEAIAWFEDVAFIGSSTTGTGVGEPQGFLNAPAAVKVTATGGNNNSVQFADIAKMYSQMWPASLNNAVWICSPDVLIQLMQMAVVAATGSSGSTDTTVAPPGWLTALQMFDYPGGGNGDGVGYRLMGRPLIVSEKMPSCLAANTTNAGALTFVDLSYYLLGDRQTMQVASSDQYLFANDLMAYRIIERLDGRFWLQSAITPENGGANKLSPLVLLDTT
jgi:HK97 family phage major capsid protein